MLSVDQWGEDKNSGRLYKVLSCLALKNYVHLWKRNTSPCWKIHRSMLKSTPRKKKKKKSSKTGTEAPLSEVVLFTKCENTQVITAMNSFRFDSSFSIWDRARLGPALSTWVSWWTEKRRIDGINIKFLGLQTTTYTIFCWMFRLSSF